MLSLVLSLSLTDSFDKPFIKNVKVPGVNAGYFGDNITISCTYVSDKPEHVAWYRIYDQVGQRRPIVTKDKTGKQTEHRYSLLKGRARIVGQASLSIANLRFNDEGDYRCEIDLVNGVDTKIKVLSVPRCMYFHHSPDSSDRVFFDLTPLFAANGGKSLFAQSSVDPSHTYEFTTCRQKDLKEKDHIVQEYSKVLQKVTTNLKDNAMISVIGSKAKVVKINGGYALNMNGQDGTSTIVHLKCGQGEPKFKFIKEDPKNTYSFDLTHATACPKRFRRSFGKIA